MLFKISIVYILQPLDLSISSPSPSYPSLNHSRNQTSIKQRLGQMEKSRLTHGFQIAESEVHESKDDKSDDGWGAIPIDNWDTPLPEPSKPQKPSSPPPPDDEDKLKPKRTFSKPTDPGH